MGILTTQIKHNSLGDKKIKKLSEGILVNQTLIELELKVRNSVKKIIQTLIDLKFRTIVLQVWE